jgi:membrane associated rhomboid family serine protease
MHSYEVSFGHVTPMVKRLLWTTIGIFLVQKLVSAAQGQPIGMNDPLTHWFGLSLGGILHVKVWQLLSYMFLHGGWWHLFLNMLMLFMLGPETERAVGSRQFLLLYLLSGMLGGVGWLIISAGAAPALPCIGASGAVFGIIGAFAALFPHRYITLLLFFVIPITMKAWVMAVGLAALELFFMIDQPFGGGVANAAHLAGCLAGYVFARTAFRDGATGIAEAFPTANPLRNWIPKDLLRRDDSAEIDRILDKIETDGIGSLTRAERATLQRRSRELRGE